VRSDEGFEELYRAEFAAVFRSAYALCGDRGLAEDAAQEAFARALARWRRLQDRPWAAGWVVTTALNVVRRALRRRPVGPAVGGSAEEEDREERMDVVRAIGGLPPRQQEVVVLHYVADLPVAEIAQAMGIEEGTVKSHLSKAREALARTLGGERVDG
jgi:RNA polymerase sigma-70 factor (sigma-E family)